MFTAWLTAEASSARATATRIPNTTRVLTRTTRLAATIEGRGAEVVIPPRKNRAAPREYDRVLYKERNKVERCVGLLKQFRRVASRYEKTARNFLGMATLAAIAVWLR